MKRVFIHPDGSRVGHAKSILETAGVPCFVRNENSHGYSGATLVGPLKMFDPELLVLNEDDYEQAMELLQDWAHPVSTGADWTCASCGETVPGSMGECWKCQTERPVE